MNVVEAIKKRCSVRSYQDRAIEKENCKHQLSLRYSLVNAVLIRVLVANICA